MARYQAMQVSVHPHDVPDRSNSELAFQALPDKEQNHMARPVAGLLAQGFVAGRLDND